MKHKIEQIPIKSSNLRGSWSIVFASFRWLKMFKDDQEEVIGNLSSRRPSSCHTDENVSNVRDFLALTREWVTFKLCTIITNYKLVSKVSTDRQKANRVTIANELPERVQMKCYPLKVYTFKADRQCCLVRWCSRKIEKILRVRKEIAVARLPDHDNASSHFALQSVPDHTGPSNPTVPTSLRLVSKEYLQKLRFDGSEVIQSAVIYILNEVSVKTFLGKSMEKNM